MTDPAETFLALFEAALKDAAHAGNVTRLSITVDPWGTGPKQVRVVILPNEPVTLSKEEIESKIRTIELTQGFHYTAEGLRVIITPEADDVKFKEGKPYYA